MTFEETIAQKEEEMKEAIQIAVAGNLDKTIEGFMSESEDDTEKDDKKDDEESDNDDSEEEEDDEEPDDE